VLAVAYLAAALHGLGGADIVGDDEAREAGIVQDIVAGHWLWPRFNGELLPDKPILYHWLAALPCAAAGFSETAVRLPSALAAAALVGWTARFGTRLAGAPAGIVAAGLLATLPALFSRARVARPDALLVLLLALALGLAFRWWQEGRRSHAVWSLVALGAATLAKGPVAPALFVLTLGAFAVWQREPGRLRALVTPAGAGAFLVLGLGWYALSLAGWGELFVREHLVGRYVYNLAGELPEGGTYSRRSLLYHLLFYPKLLPAVALPWTPLVALALWQAWQRDRLRDPAVRFLLCWALAPAVVFAPAQYKLRHYLLPSLPALALLAAPAAVSLARRGRARAGWLLVLAGALAAAASTALVVRSVLTGALPLSTSDAGTVGALVAAAPGGGAGVGAAAALAAAVVAAFALRGLWTPLVVLTAAGSVAWMLAGAPALERAITRRDSLKGFAFAVAGHTPPGSTLAFYGETIRPVAVYLGRETATVARSAPVTPGLVLIARGADYDALARDGRVGPPLLEARGRVGNLERGRALLAVAGASRSRASALP
jgi:4-amino-4-deoxy-L-arabinose transferase-like glycosyltransferase